MTQQEFTKGWKLLILQPWGWRYRSLTPAGQPTEESRLQMEFYFAKVQWADGRAWQHVADLFAQGQEWPSVSAVRTALQQVNPQYVRALPLPQSDGVPCPPEARELLRKLVPGWGGGHDGEAGNA